MTTFHRKQTLSCCLSVTGTSGSQILGCLTRTRNLSSLKPLQGEVLAGVLDSLLEHGSEDPIGVEALLRMVPPLQSALDFYRDQATITKRSLAQVVMLEAAVQGW